MPSALERALARFRPDGPPSDRHSERDAGDVPARISAAEFRAVTQQRLRTLEREVGEVKRRVNGLIYVVAGAVIAEIVLKLIR